MLTYILFQFAGVIHCFPKVLNQTFYVRHLIQQLAS